MASSNGQPAQLHLPRAAAWGVNLCRMVLALVFILSGFVKAIDPLGTQYKIDDYLAAMHLGHVLPGMVTLAVAVALPAVEFCLGIFLLFAIRRRLTSRLALLVMAVMTPLTLWLALANPVTDCGCFGDCVVLTNWQTLWKNVVLLGAAIVVARWPRAMFRFVSESNQWIVINYSALFILAVAVWSLYDLPQLDCRPYHVGANIKQGMEIPEDAELPRFETTYLMERNGTTQEFTVDNYPDSTWTLLEVKTVQVSAGYVPPIHDFSMVLTDSGDDIAERVLADSSYTMLLVSPHLEAADDSQLDRINQLYEYCREHAYPFYGLTASGPQAIARWRDLTGAEYPFCQADEVTLKTIIRSNPGLLLLKQGTIVRKWSHNRLPVIDDAQAGLPLEQLEEGHLPTDTTASRIVRLVMWFVLPLMLLSIADRLWMWTKWVRRKKKQQPNSNNKNIESQ